MTIDKYVVHGDRLMQVKDSTKLDSLVKFSDVYHTIQRLEKQLELADNMEASIMKAIDNYGFSADGNDDYREILKDDLNDMYKAVYDYKEAKGLKTND